MVACVLALLLTILLCLGGRQPEAMDTTDTSGHSQKQSGAETSRSDRELNIADTSTLDHRQRLAETRQNEAQSDASSSIQQITRPTQSTISEVAASSTHVGPSHVDGDKRVPKHDPPDPLLSIHTLESSKPPKEREKSPTVGLVRKSVTQEPSALHPPSLTTATCDLPCRPCHCTRNRSEGVVADCSDRHLEEIPASLPADLTSLVMARNRLHILTEGAFSGFPNLTTLDLSDNLISKMNRQAFQGLPDLRILHLHGNKLRYTPDVFTAEVLAPLGNLRHLTLHSNTDDMAEDLDYPELALAQLPLLEELSLDGLTSKTFGRGFANLTRLVTLTLSGIQGFCQMNIVSNETFQTVTSLRNLYIVKCDLREIETGAFLPLRKIDTLDISENSDLGMDAAMGATYGLQGSSIRAYHVNEIVSYYTLCIVLTVKHLQYFAYTHIEELHAELNAIQTMEKGALLAFQHNLKRLYVGGNRVIFGPYWFDLIRMQKLELLHAGMDGMTFPLPPSSHVLFGYFNEETSKKETSRTHSKRHIFPVTKAKKTKSGMYPTNDDLRPFVFPLPPNLKEINLRGNLLRTAITAVVFSLHNSLQVIDASVNLIKSWIGPVRNLHQLKSLNLSQNYADHINFTVSSDFSSLETLDISYNFLSEAFADERSIQAFGALKSLQHLNISFNGLYVLHAALLRQLPSLVTLHLAGNKFTAKDFKADLSLMPNLTMLDLSSNSLEGLSPEIRLSTDKLTAGRKWPLTLDLRTNPLSCTCGNLDFLRWLHKAHVQLVQAKDQRCIYENASHVLLWAGLEELEGSCGERGLLFAGSALAFVLLCVVIVGLVLYRYRWKLKYLYYVHRGRYMQEQVNREHFRYDVFLSYDTDDYQWVTGQLLPHLEAQGLRVCFHERDFLPGRPIAANIVEAVQTSRRTVCVLSPNFLDSQWCLYEMQMAIIEGVHSHRDVLLLLIYEHVGPQALPREVLHYYHSDSYLEYPRDARCRPFFWENLDLALR